MRLCGHRNEQPDVMLITQGFVSFCTQMCVWSSLCSIFCWRTNFLGNHILLASMATKSLALFAQLIRVIPIDRISCLFCFPKRLFVWEKVLSMVMPQKSLLVTNLHDVLVLESVRKTEILLIPSDMENYSIGYFSILVVLFYKKWYFSPDTVCFSCCILFRTHRMKQLYFG